MKVIMFFALLAINLLNCQADDAAFMVRNEIIQNRVSEFGNHAIVFGCKTCEFPMLKLASTLDGLDENANAMGSGYAEYANLVKNLTNNYNNTTINSINFEISLLNLQLSYLKNELSALKSELEKAKDKSESIKREIKNKINEENEYVKQTEKLISDFNSLKTQIQAPQSELAACMQEIDSNSKVFTTYRQVTPGAEHVSPWILEKHAENFSDSLKSFKEYTSMRTHLEDLLSKTSNILNRISEGHRENNLLIKEANRDVREADKRIENGNSEYNRYANEFSKLQDKIKTKTNELERVNKQDRSAIERLGREIDYIRRDVNTLESNVRFSISNVRNNAEMFLRSSSSNLRSVSILTGKINDAKSLINSGNSYLNSLSGSISNICQIKNKDNQQINPLRKFLNYRKYLESEISRSTFNEILKTTPEMKGYKELAYLKARQNIIEQWPAVEDANRTREILQVSKSLIELSDNYLSKENKLDDLFLKNMKDSIMTMQDYGANVLSFSSGFVPYINQIKDLIEVILNKDGVTGLKFGNDMRVILLGATVMSNGVTSVRPFVIAITPDLLKSLNLSPNAYTQKVLINAAKSGMYSSDEIKKNIQYLAKLDPELNVLAEKTNSETQNTNSFKQNAIIDRFSRLDKNTQQQILEVLKTGNEAIKEDLAMRFFDKHFNELSQSEINNENFLRSYRERMTEFGYNQSKSNPEIAELIKPIIADRNPSGVAEVISDIGLTKLILIEGSAEAATIISATVLIEYIAAIELFRGIFSPTPVGDGSDVVIQETLKIPPPLDPNDQEANELYKRAKRGDRGAYAEYLNKESAINSKKTRIDDRGKKHILDGDKRGGGHRAGTNNSGKTEFPKAWSDDKIIESIEEVANDPKVTSRDGKWNSKIKTKNIDGVDVEVIIDNNGNIVTGYPINVPMNL